jgi:Na+/melibiose symporter-like transporter
LKNKKALCGINMTVNLFPALLFIAASVCCLLWNMSDKDADEIRAKLHERHTANAAKEQ